MTFPAFQMSMNDASFIYNDEDGQKHEQPVGDVFEAGTLIDENGNDMEEKQMMELSDSFTIFDPVTKTTLTIYRSQIDDCPFVVQVDTDVEGGDPRIRMNLNDGTVFDGHAESNVTYDLD